MATLYVNSITGNDAITKANNSNSTPWLTIGRSAWGNADRNTPNPSQAAIAGDLTIIEPGIYYTQGYPTNNSGARHRVALNPINSGGVANGTIHFKGNGTVEVRSVGTSNIYGPLIGADFRQNVVWEGITIDDYYGASVPDTGPVVFVSSDGGQLLRCNITGHSGNYASGLLFEETGASAETIGTTVITGAASHSRVGDKVAFKAAAGNSYYYWSMPQYEIISIANSTHMTINTAPSPAWPAGSKFYTPRYSQNYALVRVDSSNNVTIANNYIQQVWGYGVTPQSGGHNDGSIMLYGSEDSIIEHNNISDAGIGVFVKGISYSSLRNQRINVRFNLVSSSASGFRAGFCDDTRFYQNIIKDCTQYAFWCGFAGDNGLNDEAIRVRILNNTTYNCKASLSIQGNNTSDIHFNNNLLANSYYAAYMNHSYSSFSPTDEGTHIFERNFYSGFPGNRFAEYQESIDITLASWQGTYARDTTSSNGIDPLFINTGIGDLHLSESSLARTSGRVTPELIGGANNATIPVGAYIFSYDIIGVVPYSEADLTPPGIPLGFFLF